MLIEFNKTTLSSQPITFSNLDQTDTSLLSRNPKEDQVVLGGRISILTSPCFVGTNSLYYRENN